MDGCTLRIGGMCARSDGPWKTERPVAQTLLVRLLHLTCANFPYPVAGLFSCFMTRNRMRVAIQSGCVTKILALQQWSKIDFPPEFQTRQMHSFPIMYNTMGSKLDGLAVRDHFLPKNGLKTAILGLTILDRLTSEGAGTKIFEAIANFSMCFEKCGTLSSI